MRSKSRQPGFGWAFSAMLGCSALLAGTAQADTAAHPAAGALQLPNVRMQMATPRLLEQAARSTGASQGMRAYINPETNELRDQTPEEMFMAAPVVKAARAKTLAKAAASPSGGVVMETDEDMMSYSVVSRDASGKLNSQCVSGEKSALQALTRAPGAKEHRHDH